MLTGNPTTFHAYCRDEKAVIEPEDLNKPRLKYIVPCEPEPLHIYFDLAAGWWKRH